MCPSHCYRCRDKQRKESSRLQAVNRKLTAMNKLLMEENERLQKQVSQLVHENAHMRQQLQSVSSQRADLVPFRNLLFVETFLVATVHLYQRR
jgi:7-cyano-7-deazaguanine synthase in queuosine biosynthesis